MTFRSINLAATLVCAILAVVLIFLPEFIYWLFSLTGDAIGDFLAKRAGMLFLGLATLLYFSRNSEVSSARSAISLGLAVAMCGLALVGTYEYFRGYAGPGIWFAIITETSFAIGYALVLFSDRRTGHTLS